MRPATVRMRAPAVAWQAYQAAWAFEPALPDADVATLHELRIATKWLRYTLEFLREPMEPQATELIRRVVALQDQLGRHPRLPRRRRTCPGDCRRAHRTSDPVSGPPSSGSRPPRTCGSSGCAGGSGRPGGASPTPTTGAGSDGRSPDSERSAGVRRARRSSSRRRGGSARSPRLGAARWPAPRCDPIAARTSSWRRAIPTSTAPWVHLEHLPRPPFGLRDRIYRDSRLMSRYFRWCNTI